METFATLKYAKSSALKARLVADEIRGKSVENALNILKFLPHKCAAFLRKVLESAIANAEHNHGADIDNLRISAVFVDEAGGYKRMMPRAKGRGNRIVKRLCHITIKLNDDLR